MIQKVLAFLVRPNTENALELLVFVDPNGHVNVPKGTVEKDENLLQAVLRELHEESGILAADVVLEIGRRITMIPGGVDMDGPLEEQEHIGFLLRTSSALPDTWDHTVESDGIDNGWLFRYRWIPLTIESGTELFYGADWFIEPLLHCLNNTTT